MVVPLENKPVKFGRHIHKVVLSVLQCLMLYTLFLVVKVFFKLLLNSLWIYRRVQTVQGIHSHLPHTQFPLLVALRSRTVHLSQWLK